MKMYLVLLVGICNGESLVSFLQGTKDASTSLGSLGEGVESISESLETLGEELTGAFEVLQEQIEDIGSINSDTANALIVAYLNELQREEGNILYLIEIYEEALDSLEGCGSYLTCYQCTSNSECMWCLETEECVQVGDEQCQDYEYGECAATGCELYTSCNNCIADPECGWCGDSGACLDSSSQCHEEDYYDMNSANCPEPDNDPGGLDASDFPIVSNEKVLSVGELKDILNRLSGDLELIQENIEELERELEGLPEGQGAATVNIVVESQLSGLGASVDAQHSNEIRQDQQFQSELLDDSESRIINELSEAIDESTDSITVAIDEAYPVLPETEQVP